MPEPRPRPGARVLVTGASRGIGREIATALHADGARLWLCSRHEAADAASFTDGARTSLVDVGDDQSVDALFAEIANAWGGLDAVVHCAAELGATGDFWDLDPGTLVRAFDVNTAGSFRVTRSFVRQRRLTDGDERGKVVLFAGGGAGYGYPRFVPYGTSKAALVRLCETMAMELDDAGIAVDVNAIAPGANETAMLAAVRAAGGEVRTTVPFSKPIALCRWLISPESDGVSGRFIHVNDAYPKLESTPLAKDALRLRRVDP